MREEAIVKGLSVEMNVSWSETEMLEILPHPRYAKLGKLLHPQRT
jgi:hypothetical protein